VLVDAHGARIILEVLGLALGQVTMCDSRTNVRPLLVNHFERELVFLAWLAVASSLMRNRRRRPERQPDVIGTLGWLALLGLSPAGRFSRRQHPTSADTHEFHRTAHLATKWAITLLVFWPSRISLICSLYDSPALVGLAHRLRRNRWFEGCGYLTPMSLDARVRMLDQDRATLLQMDGRNHRARVFAPPSSGILARPGALARVMGEGVCHPLARAPRVR